MAQVLDVEMRTAIMRQGLPSGPTDDTDGEPPRAQNRCSACLPSRPGSITSMMRRHLTLPDASLVHTGKAVLDALVAGRRSAGAAAGTLPCW